MGSCDLLISQSSDIKPSKIAYIGGLVERFSVSSSISLLLLFYKKAWLNKHLQSQYRLECKAGIVDQNFLLRQHAVIDSCASLRTVNLSEASSIRL